MPFAAAPPEGGLSGTVAGFPPPAVATRALVVLALLGFITAVDTQMTGLLIEPMKRDLDLSDVQIGLLQGTAFGLAYSVTAIPLGRLIDSRNRLRLLNLGVVLYAGAMAASAFATGIGTLLACRALLGATSGLLLPASLSLLSDLFPPARRTVSTSLFVVGQSCGAGVGILAGGLVFDAVARLLATSPGLFGGLTAWRVLYLGAGAICLLVLLPLAALREPMRQERDGEARSILAALRELWAYRGFLAPVVLALLFSTIALTGPTVWAAPLLIRSYALTPGAFAGWLAAVTLGSTILGALSAGRLAELARRRIGPLGVVLPALVAVLVAAPLSFFAMASTVPLFAAMLALSLFCYGLIQTIAPIAFTLNIPNEIRGVGLGIYPLVVALLGTATAPAAIALVSRALGGETMLPQAIALVSVPSALASAAFFGLTLRGRGLRRAV